MEQPADLLAYRDGFAEHAHVRSRRVLGDNNQSEPLVSILIPTFRRPRLLREAIGSALAQDTREVFEVVVVDNDSDPATSADVEQVISSFNSPNLSLYRNDDNIGMFGNWNRCLQLARGRWVTILCDDDLLAPAFLATCLSALVDNPAIRLISCKVDVLDERGMTLPSRPLLRRLGRLAKNVFTPDRLGPPRRLRLEHYFLANPHAGSLGILMSREAAIELGGFSTALFPSADFIFFVRFQMAHGAYHLRRRLAKYRIAVNESLNPALLKGWLHQGLRVRSELALHINCSPTLLDLYARLQAIEFARTHSIVWSPRSDIDALLREVKLPNIPVYVIAHALRVALRLLLAVREGWLRMSGRLDES